MTITNTTEATAHLEAQIAELESKAAEVASFKLTEDQLKSVDDRLQSRDLEQLKSITEAEWKGVSYNTTSLGLEMLKETLERVGDLIFCKGKFVLCNTTLMSPAGFHPDTAVFFAPDKFKLVNKRPTRGLGFTQYHDFA